MSFLVSAFNLILYQPLFNALVLFYIYLPGQDFGLAVIILTILVKLIFYPLGVKAIHSQRALAELQPKIKQVQEQFKNNKEKQVRAIMDLYKEKKISPFSGFLPLLLQLPILIGLYRVFWNGFDEDRLGFLYSFVPNPGPIDTTFLGIMDLAQASVILAVLTGITQFIQTKMLTAAPVKATAKTKQSDFSQMMQKQMLYFFPIFTVFILWRLPAAIALYWLTTTLFTILQQYVILNRPHDSGRPKEN